MRLGLQRTRVPAKRQFHLVRHVREVCNDIVLFREILGPEEQLAFGRAVQWHEECPLLVTDRPLPDMVARVGVLSNRWDVPPHQWQQAEAVQVNAIIDRLNADGSRLDHHLAEIAAGLSLLPAPEESPETIERIDDLQRSLGTCREIVAGWGASQTRE